MTVAEVWGRVEGSDVAPLTHSGDDWLFPLDEGRTGSLVVEFWAEDDAGNIGYRAGILTIRPGGVKCWRWLATGCECTMLATVRPACADARPHALACDARDRADAVPAWVRPLCEERPHACPAIGG